MTISNTSYQVYGYGDGVTVNFAFPFKIFNATDLLVYLIQTSTGNQTLQAITTNYSVTINPIAEGGSVTFVVPPPIGYEYFIERIEPFTQSVVIPTEGALPALQISNQLDLLTMLCIQMNGAIQGLNVPGSYPNVVNLGNPNTNGSWRIILSGNNLSFQNLVLGVWIEKFAVIP